jgi:hypothetical protein
LLSAEAKLKTFQLLNVEKHALAVWRSGRCIRLNEPGSNPTKEYKESRNMIEMLL